MRDDVGLGGGVLRLLALVVAASASAASLSCTPRPPPPPPPAPHGAVVVPSAGAAQDLERAAAFWATRPGFERPLSSTPASVPGLTSLSSQACAACHDEIAAEWALSTHAVAWIDRQFQAELAKSDNRWLCLNCHTPLLQQHDRWPIGLFEGDVERPRLVDNAGFDAALRDEGITCAGCHVEGGAIHGPGLPPVAGASASPHPVVADARFQRADNRLCERCHQATATYPGKTFVCTFTTGEEWAAGPYATTTERRGCVDCHMPIVERPAAKGGPVRTVRRHFWRGAGIPKIAGRHPPVEANPPGLGLDVRWQASGLSIVVDNARAGHKLPTGDPERFIVVEVTWRDAQGAAVGAPWSTRFGQRWEWWPAPKKLDDVRLAPRESASFDVPRPPGAVAADVVATSHRMSEDAARYHKLDGYPTSIVTHRLHVDERGASGGIVAP